MICNGTTHFVTECDRPCNDVGVARCSNSSPIFESDVKVSTALERTTTDRAFKHIATHNRH